MSGDVAHAELDYIIRDHDRERFEQRKRYMKQAVELLNAEYGYELATIEITDSYYNMKEMILPHMELIDLARESMEELDIEPLIIAVRGGTTGALVLHGSAVPEHLLGVRIRARPLRARVGSGAASHRRHAGFTGEQVRRDSGRGCEITRLEQGVAI